jgi:hypothetical protein
LATGEMVLKAQVEPLDTLDGVVVLRSGGRYVVLTSRPDPNPSPFGVFFQPGTVGVGGWAHGFDAKGTKLWSSELPTQSLSVFQPHDLPVLFLFRRHMKGVRLANGGIQGGGVEAQVFCLDTRNGKALHEDAANNDNDIYEVDVDPGKKVEFQSHAQSVTVTFPGPQAAR